MARDSGCARAADGLVIAVHDRRWIVVAACIALACRAAAASTNWSGTSGAYVVRQSAGDLVVSIARGGTAAFSATAFAKAQYGRLLVEFGLPSPPLSGASPAMFVRHRFRFMSLVGPLLAVRDEADVDVKANAVPAGRTRFWTIDLRKGARYGFGDDPLEPSPNSPGAFVDLESLFPEGAIATAIVGSDLGRRAGSKPGEALSDVLYDLAQVGRRAPNCFLPQPGPTWSFALAGTTPSQVAVDLGLPGQISCRTNMTVLRLELPRSGLHRRLGEALLPPTDLGEATIELGTSRRQ